MGSRKYVLSREYKAKQSLRERGKSMRLHNILFSTSEKLDE